MGAEEIRQMKGKNKIAVLTAYDYCTARALESSGIDIILVGDSLGNVVLGFDSTREVRMADMIRHTQAVRNGAKDSFIVSDMPFGSEKDAVDNAKMLLDAGADAVKIEGKPDVVKLLAERGFDVMGHIGHLPQTALRPMLHKDEEKLIQEATQIEKAGAFALVLEMIETNVARKITEAVHIPTIGIGAGRYCDGQVLVINDMLGLYDKFTPKFVKQYANLSPEIRKAVRKYIDEVQNGKFP